MTESEFAKFLQDHERSFEALRRAHAANPRDPFIASRLASILIAKGDPAAALAVVREALESNQSDRRLNFQYAELLRNQPDVSREELAYHYRRDFIKWDENYDSQFWFARFTYENDDSGSVAEAREVFRHLRDVPMSHDARTAVRDIIGGIDSPKEFSGTVSRVEATHGFVSVDGRADNIFFHETDVKNGVWEPLSRGTRVVFNIGFSLRGPKAINLHLEGIAAASIQPT